MSIYNCGCDKCVEACACINAGSSDGSILVLKTGCCFDIKLNPASVVETLTVLNYYSQSRILTYKDEAGVTHSFTLNNDIQQITLAGKVITLSKGGGSIDLTSLIPTFVAGECISLIPNTIGNVTSYIPTIDWFCAASKICPICNPSDPLQIIIDSLSTSSTFTPTSISNTGSTLNWNITGGVITTGTGNSPIFNFSGNTGTAHIVITNGDSFASLIDITMPSLRINNLDIHNAINLQSINFSDNQLTALSVYDNIHLTQFRASSNLISTVDFSHNPVLQIIGLSTNNLSSLNITNNTNLTFLDCSSNHITSLNTTNNTLLQTLTCYANNISSLNLATNTAITYLNCNTNSLTGINVSTLSSLNYLNVSHNAIGTLNISPNTQLVTLEADGIGINTISTTANTILQNLHIENNTLSSSPNLSTNTALLSINLQNCGISTLNLSTNNLLQEVIVNMNNLTTLNISNLIHLTSLEISTNNLTTLNISTNTALTHLILNGNIGLNPATLSNILITLNSFSTSGGTLNYNSTSTPDITSLTAYNSLVSRGWTIIGPTPA